MRSGTVKKVLLLLSNKIERRGGQVYLFNWINYAPKDKYLFTLYFSGDLADKAFAQEFQNAGATVYNGNIDKLGRIKKNIRYIKDIRRLLKKEKYDIIHIHTGSPHFSAIGLLLGWIYGVPCRISHSHTSFNEEKWYKRLYYALPRMINRRLPFRYIGVSRAAVEFLFGKSAYRKEDRVRVISPRIDTKRFAFCEEVRNEYRNKFSMEEDFVIGHVGGFTPEKNHTFLLDVFQAVVAKRDNVKLLLIGSGEEEKKIRSQVNRLGLQNRVIFGGSTDSVQDYLCAMDCFVLPSLREGFSIVLLEAQASGLPCIASNGTPPEVCVTELLRYLPLNYGSKKWAEAVLDIKAQTSNDREESWKHIYKADFDNTALTKIIGDLYQ